MPTFLAHTYDHESILTVYLEDVEWSKYYKTCQPVYHACCSSVLSSYSARAHNFYLGLCLAIMLQSLPIMLFI